MTFNIPLEKYGKYDKYAKLPMVSVDISGSYTENSQSTGYCEFSGQDPYLLEGESLNQEGASEKAGIFIHKHPEVCLILESPLSYAFKEGCAVCREIEKGNNYPKFEEIGNSVRPWTINAGSSSALGALLFLEKLNSRCKDKETVVYLFEGFHTWKSGDKKKSNHKKDAEDLINGLKNGNIHRLPAELKTALNLLGFKGKTTHVPPPVVFAKRELLDSFQHPK